jgi:two-component system cell cycle sensor histidine kinase/response regulator CckA
VVLGFSTLLLERRHDGPFVADVRQIHKAAERASATSRQLLAFSRRLILRPQVLDLNRLISGLEPVLQRVLGEDKVFIAELEPDSWRVQADPGQLEQVVVNLALNARDAMPTDGTFTIATRNVMMPARPTGSELADELPPGQYVLLAVRDTGHGMDAATRARIFEPFFTTKPLGRGTGLGLATAFGIVRQSGGTIRVHTAPGAGSSFNIYLPALVDATLPPDAEPAPLERGNETVLVVEDEALVRQFTCQLLQGQGYRCLEAANGTEALDLVQRHGDEINVVVTDVVMPGMGGSVLAEHLAALRPGLPVLFMSAYANEEVIRRGLLNRGASFVQKPFTPAELSRRLRELLTGPGRR